MPTITLYLLLSGSICNGHILPQKAEWWLCGIAPSNLVIYSTDRSSLSTAEINFSVSIRCWSTFDDARRAWPMCNDFDQHDDEELWIKWLFILMGSEDPISWTFRKWGLSSIIMDSYKSSPPLTTFPSWWFSSHTPGRLLFSRFFFKIRNIYEIRSHLSLFGTNLKALLNKTLKIGQAFQISAWLYC